MCRRRRASPGRGKPRPAWKRCRQPSVPSLEPRSAATRWSVGTRSSARRSSISRFPRSCRSMPLGRWAWSRQRSGRRWTGPRASRPGCAAAAGGRHAANSRTPARFVTAPASSGSIKPPSPPPPPGKGISKKRSPSTASKSNGPPRRRRLSIACPRAMNAVGSRHASKKSPAFGACRASRGSSPTRISTKPTRPSPRSSATPPQKFPPVYFPPPPGERRVGARHP